LHLIGDFGVGKNSLITRFIFNTYTQGGSQLIFDDLCRKIKKEGQQVEIWVNHDQSDKYRTRTSTPYRRSHGIMICFDVTNKLSWTNVRNWLQEVYRYTKEEHPVIIVGCKADYLAIPPSNTFNPFVLTSEIDPNLPIWYQNSILCSSDFFSHLLPFLTHTHIMILRLVCKWLYNNTINSIKEDKSQVTKEEVKEFCDIHGLDVAYISSKYGVGIDEMVTNFAMLAYAVKEEFDW